MWRVNCRDKHKSADDDGKHMEKSSSTEESCGGFSRACKLDTEIFPRLWEWDGSTFPALAFSFPQETIVLNTVIYSIIMPL